MDKIKSGTVTMNKFNPGSLLEEYTISAFKLAKAFIENKTLVHVDLSFNSFKTPDIRYIGKRSL